MNNPNITSLEEINDIIPDINLENENSTDSNLAFTFGFTAGLWDLKVAYFQKVWFVFQILTPPKKDIPKNYPELEI